MLMQAYDCQVVQVDDRCGSVVQGLKLMHGPFCHSLHCKGYTAVQGSEGLDAGMTIRAAC